MSFRAPMDLRAGSPVHGTPYVGPGTAAAASPAPTSLRLVQPHPGFANRLRSRSDAHGSGVAPGTGSPTYTRYHHRPLLLGSGTSAAPLQPAAVPEDGTSGMPAHAHVHTSSDIENQMPPSFRAPSRAGMGTRREQSPMRGKGAGVRAGIGGRAGLRDQGKGYGYGHAPEPRHAQQHSFSHSAAHAGSSRNDNLGRGSDDAQMWYAGYDREEDPDRGDTSTPRAGGGLEEEALRDDRPRIADVTPLGEPLVRFDTSTSSIRSDGDVEPHYGMPPISLGVLRHRRQASSMDISDGSETPEAHVMGGSTPAVMMRAHTHAATTATAETSVGNERAILQELANSKDDGNTLDLSRKGIERITEGDARLLRCGVGKAGKGVWRCVGLGWRWGVTDS